jgi:hypothetical protein
MLQKNRWGPLLDVDITPPRVNPLIPARSLTLSASSLVVPRAAGWSLDESHRWARRSKYDVFRGVVALSALLACFGDILDTRLDR